jgi:hypothetical protein
MRYSERPEFPYDTEVFKLKDTQTALRIYAEMTKKHSARPTPRFLEVNRDIADLDPLWHTTADGKEKIKRQLDIPAINIFPNGKNEWMMTPQGMLPQRRDDFILSHKALIEFDYFPVQGDYVLWNGYTYMLKTVVIPGEAYWHQTNVWLGLQVKCIIPAVGDGMPSFPPPIKTQLPLPTLEDTPLGGMSPPNGPPVSI